ncbi:MAG TPA: glycosyltransferase family 39 protein, partial [Candidatus Fimivivens sp.]|nr:glycosyltransferase family 39 protein [Candidatus Fimivivens sp.]
SVMLLITLAGFAIRNYRIESVPSGLYPDEAMNGVDGLVANESGDYRIFYPNNNGREGLFINLQALTVKTFGNTIPALKLWSEIFGALAVLGIGLLAWELFRSRYAAIAASLIVATSFWAISFSRIGFRAIMVPFLLSFSFFFFFRGLRNGKIFPFVFSGFFFGLGLNTYVAFRLAPLILILIFPFLFLSYRSFFRRFWKHALVFVLFAALGAAPMLYAIVKHPEIFSSRSAAVSILSPEVNQGDFFGTLAKTLGLSLIKYDFVGDQNWRHNYPPYPILDPIVGTLFLAGFLFSIGMFIRILGKRLRTGKPDSELTVHAFLLAGFFSMLAPEFLTNEGLPHALRAIGTQPFVFLFATMPLVFLFRRFREGKGGKKVAFALFLVLALAGSGTFNLVKYFSFYRNNPNQHGAFSESITNMAYYLNSLPDDVHKYVYANGGGLMVDNGLPISAQPIVFLTHGKAKNLEFLTPDSVIRSPGVIILMNYDQRIFENIKKFVPAAYEQTIDLDPGYGSDFKAIILPKSGE